MSTPIHRCTISFVVRIWAEYLDQQPPSWRGVLESCDQGENFHFASLKELTALIQEKTTFLSKMEEEK